MKKTFIFIIFCIYFCSFVFAQNMNDNITRSLFSDHKATQVGDAVTIIIVEQNGAQNNGATQTSRESKLSVGASGSYSTSGTSKSLPGVSASVGTGNGFDGSGSTSNKNEMKAKLSAKITSIDDNGNLKIEGTRKMTINKEEQIIKVSGTIRPQDILPDNSIYSYNISDAVIIYQGDGIVSSSQSPGWLTKIFHWIF